jgi:hypothetical protein
MPASRYSTALLKRPSTDVEYGASQAAFELRYGLRPPTGTAPPAAPPAPVPDGRQLVNSAAIAALTNPLCHTEPEDELGELITDVMDLPEAQRSTVRTLVSGMLRSVTAKPSMIFAMVAFVATLGLGLNTDIGRAAAHTVAETTRDVGRAVVKRAAEVVSPAVQLVRRPSVDTPRQHLGAGPSAASTRSAAGTAVAPASGTGKTHVVLALAITAGGATSDVDRHHEHVAGTHRRGGSHVTGFGASHGANKTDRAHQRNVDHARRGKAANVGKSARTGKNAHHGKGGSERSSRRG